MKAMHPSSKQEPTARRRLATAWRHDERFKRCATREASFACSKDGSSSMRVAGRPRFTRLDERDGSCVILKTIHVMSA